LGKSLQFGLTLTCLVCVLAIFIAPSIDMPETVLQLHHTTLRAAGAPSAGTVGIAVTTTFSVQHQSSGSWHSSRISRPLGPILREVSTVMRC
jgi:hypothetical protein